MNLFQAVDPQLINRGTNISLLAMTVVIFSLTLSGSPKIKP